MVLFLVYATTSARTLVNDDVYGAGLASWRIASTGEPWLEGVATEEIGITRTHDGWAVVAANGHLVNPRSPGVVAAGTPAYWLSGAGTDPDDFSLAPGALTAALLAALTGMLLFLTISRSVSQPVSLLVVATFAVATPMWSVAGNGVWTHTVTTLGIVGMAWAADRGKWWLVGLFGAIGLWGRVHVALIVAILGLGLAIARRQPRIAVTIGAVSVTGMGLASVWSHWMYGTWSPTGGYSGEDYLTVVSDGGLGTVSGIFINELAMWVSLDRGILIWTPLIALMSPALVRSWSHLPDWSRFLLIGGLIYTFTQAYFSEFHGGDGFYGYRHGLEFLAAATPALALSVPRLGSVGRAAAGPLISIQFAAIAVGAMSEGFFVFRDMAWRENAFWLALTHAPAVWVWLGIMTLVGVLGARVWRDRGYSVAPTTIEVHHADSTTGPSTG